jgi:hypothetical protein
MSDRLHGFVALSALLTGFDEVQLLGSGVAEEHLATLDSLLPGAVVSGLLKAIEDLPPEGDRQAAINGTILADPMLGPVARNLIVLWYSGIWTQLPAAWRETHGASPLDTTRTTSGAAYRAGLQWLVAGAHAPGASHQGFGAWSLEPKTLQATRRQA